MDEDDDWLESGPAHQGSSADPLVEQEYQRLATRYSDVRPLLRPLRIPLVLKLMLRAGYREGITDGKLTTLQQGFDASFAASVPPSRRLGNLRGQANALLSYLTRPNSGSPELVESARELVQDLARVKRVQVLPRDLERERHEQEEHGGDDTFELEPTDNREMEGLEDALGSLGANGKGAVNESKALREAELLDSLQAKLEELKQRVKA
jgi:hypothetical protein